MSKVKIVHVITRFIRGGADENTLLSCNHQAAAGMEVHLIAGRETSQKILEKLDPSVKVHIVPTLIRAISPYHDLVALLSIARILRSTRPDIVHTHTSKAGILGRLGAKCTDAAVVHGIHILPFLNVGRVQKAFYLFLERALAKVTDMFVSVSDGMSTSALEHGIGVPHQHVVIPSGMDIDKHSRAIPHPRTAICEELGDRGDLVVVAMAAALEKRKRIYEFLNVFEKVVREHPNTVLILLGEGPERARLETRIDELALGSNVFILGFKEDVERWIATADICTLASEREGLPRVIVQYALARKPIVTTHLPGVEAVVRHGQTGYLTDPASVSAMERPLVQLVGSAELRQTMSARASEVDLSAWGVDHMANALMDVYSHVMERSVLKRTA